MVAGHLTLKNGKYYAVLNYKKRRRAAKNEMDLAGTFRKGK